MERGKIVYLDEYRKKRLSRQKSLREMIEGHLAEAGLMERVNGACKKRGEFQSMACDKKWPDGAVEEDAG